MNWKWATILQGKNSKYLCFSLDNYCWLTSNSYKYFVSTRQDRNISRRFLEKMCFLLCCWLPLLLPGHPMLPVFSFRRLPFTPTLAVLHSSSQHWWSPSLGPSVHIYFSKMRGSTPRGTDFFGGCTIGTRLVRAEVVSDKGDFYSFCVPAPTRLRSIYVWVTQRKWSKKKKQACPPTRWRGAFTMVGGKQTFGSLPKKVKNEGITPPPPSIPYYRS